MTKIKIMTKKNSFLNKNNRLTTFKIRAESNNRKQNEIKACNAILTTF